ncbi:MAG: shikimate kinase [Clostridiales bacterium]|nr:shikimate kinase [Clostridiales bacterium]
MKKNLILIGFMGAGKTSVGEAYAKKSGWPIVDTDQLIEEEAGMTISRIFAEKGETVFRETETAVMQRLLSDCDNTVISVGGGLPLREENRKILKELGTVVFLRVQKETVLKRLAGDTTRPLLQTDDVEARVGELLAYRNPIYAEAAHIVIDTDDRTPDEIAVSAGQKAGFLIL